MSGFKREKVGDSKYSIQKRDEDAYKIWLEFSMALDMQKANIQDGRSGIDPVWRWIFRVSEEVKNQFRAEADGHPIQKFPSRQN